MKFAANLSWLFKEEACLLKRFALAKSAGFKAVELAWPYDYSIEEFRSTVQNSGLEVVLINTPPGNEGELGLAALPGREKEFLESFMKSVEYAKAANCSKIHIMAGNLPDESDETKKICKHVLIGNLKVASEILTAENMTGTIEPINKKISCPRYFYSTPEEAFSILQIVAKDNIMYQCDLYHLQIEKGNLSRFLENNIEKIGHIQIAQVPGRHEPDSDGEINYDFVFKVLKNSGYDKWIGLEYAPEKSTTDGLKWMQKW